VLVNFIVITKGSGRIAEVAARFTLDAMPGKQMAIDAEPVDRSDRRGDRQAAAQRTLEQESTFFGAMDGASKFVRGDAVAGLIIVAINIIGGFLIGVIQHKIPAGQAASTYTIMTIGDGLVSQIPALVISIAAGILVSKAGVEGAADKALVTQLAMNPVSLGMVSATAGFVALDPRHAAPSLRRHRRRHGLASLEAKSGAEGAAPGRDHRRPGRGGRGADRPGPGHRRRQDRAGLRPALLINDLDGRQLTDQIRALRKTLAAEYGFVMPPVRILDNMRLADPGLCHPHQGDGEPAPARSASAR
jgi:flagellar biosynthesis protein FlhA